MRKRFAITVLTGLSVVFIHQAVFAQTVNPPLLHCVSTQGNGNILLEWELPVNSCGPFESYSIFASMSLNGPYTEIATITSQSQTTYTDAIANGNLETWYYYMVSNFTCPGATQLYSDTIDNLDPVAPEITYITVNNGLPELHWNQSPSPEAYGYIVYRVVGTNYLPIDTIIGASVTTFTDPANSAGDMSQSYTLATIDACGHAGTINTFPHSTIFLNVTTDNCNGKGTGSWTAYKNWNGGVQHYKIFASYNGQPVVVQDSTTALSGTFTYNTQDVCVYAVAYQTGTAFSSASNIICLTPNPQHGVADLYLHNVTVASQGVNRLFYSVDSMADVLNIQIERSEDGINYTSISNDDPPTSLAGVLTFDDSTALTDLKSYYYRVLMKDGCGVTDTSNKAKTILLSGYAFSNLTNSLSWDNYLNDLDTVLSYDLQRQSLSGWNSIAVNPPQNTFEETVETLVGDSGTLCYVVTATALVAIGSVTDTVQSRSNELCLDQIVKIAMPNAFAPEGTNRVFKPVTRFTGNKTYQFEIYDRWGGMIFSTKDFDEGWDGTHDGRIVPMGAYGYYVLVVDNLGQKTERKGTVLVIR